MKLSRPFSAFHGLVLLAALSGIVASLVPGPNFFQSQPIGLYRPLAGVPFGLVVAYAVWRWGRHPRSLVAAFTAFAATLFGWQAAVNVAIFIDQLSGGLVYFRAMGWLATAADGLIGGAVGALCVWAGMAFAAPGLGGGRSALWFGMTGGLFGLLLLASDTFEAMAILMVPWQMAIMALIARGLERAAGMRLVRPV